MRVVQLPDATAFLDATHAFRSANVALTNLLGSIATAVVEGRRYADQTWLAIEDEDGVVGCAIRTAPWPLAVSPMPLEGARALGQVLRDLDPDLPGIVGPLTVVHGIADSMGREASIAVAELVRVLGDYVKPGSVPGQARVATTSDLPLAREWWGRFAADIGQPLRDIAGLPDQLEQMTSAWSCGRCAASPSPWPVTRSSSSRRRVRSAGSGPCSRPRNSADRASGRLSREPSWSASSRGAR